MPVTIPYRNVEDTAALLDFLAVDKSILVRHSMVGVPAFFYTLNHPEKVIGLVLPEGGPTVKDPKLVDVEKLKNYISEFSNVARIMREQGIVPG